MAIKDGYIRWSDDAIGAIRWDTEEKEGMAAVIDEVNKEVYEIGGGSGSDLEIAEVTLDATSNSDLQCEAAYAVSDEGVDAATVCPEFHVGETYNVIMYKGKSFIGCDTSSGTFTVSENAEITEYGIWITGNAVIKLTF